MATSRRTGTNEQVASYGTGKTYTSLTTWEAATDTDHVTDTETDVLEIYDTDASFDDKFGTMTGSTNDASYHRIVRSASGEGHDGTFANGATFASTSTDEWMTTFSGERYNSVQDLILGITVNSSSNFECIDFRAVGNSAVGVLCGNSSNSGTGGVEGFHLAHDEEIVVNSVAIDMTINGIRLDAGVGEDIRAYNYTGYANGVGLLATNSGTTIAKNCLCTNSVTEDFGTAGFSTGTDYNADSDGSDPGGGANNRLSQTFTFVGTGSDDYHLASGDAGAKGFGVDLSADSFFAFDDDIDGETISTWSIGFDALASGTTIDVAMSLGTTTGMAPQAQMTIGAGVSLTTSADMVDQNQSLMDSSMLLSAATGQSQLGGIDIDLLASLAATVQQNLSGGMAVDGAVTFAASAAHQQAVDLLLDLSQQFSIQTVLTPDAVVHVLGAIALNAGAGFTQLGSLILHTTESLAVNVDDAWQRGLLAEDVVALATQAGLIVDGEIPAGVFTTIVSLAAQTRQITDGSLVLNSVLAEEVVAQLTPSTQAVLTQLVSMGCTAAQVQAGGVLHEVIMLLGGQAAMTTTAQHAIAGTLTLAIQQAITVQSQQVGNALLSLGCTADQVQLGTSIIENLLTLSMKGALQIGATVSLANIGNIATITAEALTQPTVTNEVLRTPTVTNEKLI